LVDCERIYYEMSYLQTKRPREDAIKYKYVQIPAGLKSIVEGFDKLLQRCPELEREITNATVVLNQACSLVSCRLAMIALYQELAIHATNTNPDYDHIHKREEQLLYKYSTQIKHPWLSKLKHSMAGEVKVLKSLWKAQAHLSRYEVKDTMLWLTISREKLTEWARRVGGVSSKDAAVQGQMQTLKQIRKRLAEAKRPPLPHFTFWAEAFLMALTCKASFYFYQLFQQQALEMGADFNARLERLEMNYHAHISRLMQRAGASFHLLVDYTGRAAQTKGYECLDLSVPPRIVQGLAAWPAILTIPTGPAPLEHWPNLISLLFDHKERLQTAQDTSVFTEEVDGEARQSADGGVLEDSGKSLFSYLVNRIESRVYMVVIQEGRVSKKQDGQLLLTELTNVTHRLRLSSVFGLLRPSAISTRMPFTK
jgi:hypothetical protein